MHAISFLQKRQHLSAVARGREMFAHIEDMTPARFDLLYAMHQHVRAPESLVVSGHWITHRILRETLGLARQTIWKGVKRLIELGLVERCEEDSDEQDTTVRLTAEGIRRVRLAMNAAFSERDPLPAAAPEPGPGESVPRYWKHREVADCASIGTNGVIRGEPTVILHPEGIDRNISGGRGLRLSGPWLRRSSSFRRRDARSGTFSRPTFGSRSGRSVGDAGSGGVTSTGSNRSST